MNETTNKVFDNYNTITLEDMMKYIEDNHSEDKHWFKEQAFRDRKDKNGNIKKAYSHLVAKKAFCERYMPSLVPVAKQKATDILATW